MTYEQDRIDGQMTFPFFFDRLHQCLQDDDRLLLRKACLSQGKNFSVGMHFMESRLQYPGKHRLAMLK